ncbi:MAG: hypothetical protein HYR55_15570 [Acidobacteria bacterium]|nr:hypothetical protein [Acidobacteriota bacterium]MBI3655194.1 hypothetical protein [Acidobacteriota bacterium]
MIKLPIPNEMRHNRESRLVAPTKIEPSVRTKGGRGFRHKGRRPVQKWLYLILTTLLLSRPMVGREFLLAKEIKQIREAQEIDQRAELYLKFAAMRMVTFKERMKGIESKEGDPMEFYAPADLIHGFGRCLKAVEANIDEAILYRKTETKKLVKALSLLKNFAGKSRPDLDEAEQMAVAKKDESLYNSVKEAANITRAAIEGATEGLKVLDKGKKKKKQRNCSRGSGVGDRAILLGFLLQRLPQPSKHPPHDTIA